MKIKIILASFLSVVALNGAMAGTAWVPPAKDKCPIDECPDIGGSISIGYDSAYIFRGVRLTEDAILTDVNYSFESFSVPFTLGYGHVTGLGSQWTGLAADNDGDQGNIYASAGLPSVLGFDVALRYDLYLYPNLREPTGMECWGDSHSALSLSLSRELLLGVVATFTSTYDFHAPTAPHGHYPNGQFQNIGHGNIDTGAWIHTLDLGKSFAIRDNVGLDLNCGVLYTDNLWGGVVRGSNQAHASGWNSYYINAGLPIALNCRATLTPYLGYNGSPDTWQADGVTSLQRLSNGNDIFHGGVNIGVNF